VSFILHFFIHLDHLLDRLKLSWSDARTSSTLALRRSRQRDRVIVEMEKRLMRHVVSINRLTVAVVGLILLSNH